jgi:hypothetical protein
LDPHRCPPGGPPQDPRGDHRGLMRISPARRASPR